METQAIFKYQLQHNTLPTVRERAMRRERGPCPSPGIHMDGAPEDSYSSRKTVQIEIKDITKGGKSLGFTFLIKHVTKDCSWDSEHVPLQ